MVQSTQPEAIATIEQAPAAQLLDYMDSALRAHLLSAEKTELYQRLSDPHTTREAAITIMKYVMLEVYSYGKHIVEATFTAIGRMPLDSVGLMRAATHHILEEVTHPHLALRDFVKLGGDESWARQRRMSPESLAMAATCRMLAEHEDPFCYVGFMYLFESLTPALSERAQKFLAAKQMPANAQVFIDLHAVEDIKHIEWMRDLINRCVEQHPEAEASIKYGFDCFRAVYPFAVWEAAMRNAKAEQPR